MKTIVVGVATLAVVGCAGPHLEMKTWHKSPDPSPMSSTLYRQVDWAAVQQLHAGMTTEHARTTLGDLQSYNHPANAIVFSRHDGHQYEIALKLSVDGKTIEDISFKRRE